MTKVSTIGWVIRLKSTLLALAATMKTSAVAAAEVATLASAATGTAVSTLVGVDPWPWIIGGIGAAIVYVKKASASRYDAAMNGVISVSLAGLVAPPFSAFLGDKVSHALSTPAPVAFLLSASWPWVIPALAAIAGVASKVFGGEGK